MIGGYLPSNVEFKWARLEAENHQSKLLELALSCISRDIGAKSPIHLASYLGASLDQPIMSLFLSSIIIACVIVLIILCSVLAELSWASIDYYRKLVIGANTGFSFITDKSLDVRSTRMSLSIVISISSNL